MKHPSLISIQEFTYVLPAEKIANYPLANRDESKLLVFEHGEIKENIFKRIVDFLGKDALLVFNNTKVIQARLYFLNAKAKQIEIFCLEPAENIDVSISMSTQNNVRWNCLVGNLKQWHEPVLSFSKNNLTLEARIFEKRESYVTVDFSWKPPEFSFAEVLESLGNMPIPPYLKRAGEIIDQDRYQTVYAKQEGSVAAPTAGLHFTEDVLNALAKKNIQKLEVTLHVGAGTFKPVKSTTMLEHEMHAEWIEVSRAMLCEMLLSHNNQIIAVGTTSLRTIESLYWMGVKALDNPQITLEQIEIKQWDPYTLLQDLPEVSESIAALLAWMDKHDLKKIICKTSILIAPPYVLKIAKGIVTNFHQPQSTLLLLVAAVIGEEWRRVYDYALNNGFRFLSYGDSSLLLK